MSSAQPSEDVNGDSGDFTRSASISHKAALDYWSSVDATVCGMLGGFPEISRIDLRGSRSFITKLRRKSVEHGVSKPLARVVDCGAGIGRITLGLLVDVASVVDIVEPVESFTNEFLGKEEVKALQKDGRLGEVYVQGLEQFSPEHNYSLIWNQWCLSQLKDDELVAYLKRCIPKIEPGGWIVVKENVTKPDVEEDIFDDVDSSVTRTDKNYRKIFLEAGMKIVATEVQRGFPKDLYPVRSYALQPIGEE